MAEAVASKLKPESDLEGLEGVSESFFSPLINNMQSPMEITIKKMPTYRLNSFPFSKKSSIRKYARGPDTKKQDIMIKNQKLFYECC